MMTSHKNQQGLSLVELMIAMTIGLLLLAGLAVLFFESNRSHRELTEASKQIENGRYALQILHDDLHVAGFYGQFGDISSMAVPAALPDPCSFPAAATISTYRDNNLPVHVQGYAAADFTQRASTTNCSTWLTSANLQAGSDILVVRRVDTRALQTGDTATTNDLFLQANPEATSMQIGDGNAITDTSTADGSPLDVKILAGANAGKAAPIRKFHVHVYFVAPCSIPADGGDICTGSADDDGNPVPTLKRLELTSSGGAMTIKLVPLVEGIEMLKVDYGVDSDNDGVADGNFVRTPASVADWSNVMSINLTLLARNPQSTVGFTDTKSYQMGVAGSCIPGSAACPIPVNYKRHLYASSVRIENVSSRRELP